MQIRARWIALAVILGVFSFWLASTDAQQGARPSGPSFADLTKDLKKIPGFIDLYVGKEKVYAGIKNLNQSFMLMSSVSRGTGTGRLATGTTLGTRVLAFERGGDKKLFLMEKNVRFKANRGTPLARSVAMAFRDSPIAAIPILASGGGAQLIDLGPLFGRDFSGVGRSLGGFDASRSRWGDCKSFPNNTELRANLVFRGAGRSDTVANPAGTPITMHYSLSRMPSDGYQPRLADPRVGYFLSAHADFSKKGSTHFVRYINRWNLQKADPRAARSPAKKSVIYWIENTTPFELRPYIRAALEEWNKAFEQAGIINAIEVRQMPDDADWDPEDARYNTIRWVTGHPMGYAIGPSRVNPLTGQIIDADILIDADFLMGWRSSHNYLLEKALVDRRRDRTPDELNDFSPLSYSESYQEAQAMRESLGLDETAGQCQYAQQKSLEMGLARVHHTLTAQQDEGGTWPTEPSIEFIGENLKDLVMHEVGHTLGLRHNFKASTMLSVDELGDRAKAEEVGLFGSVMDYAPLIIASDPEKQGYFATPTIGPYDRWAIEYGYSVHSGGTKGEVAKLREIASRSGAPELAYGTDGDVGIDPYTNRWDMATDPLKFAADRLALFDHLLEQDWTRLTHTDRGYVPVRSAFGVLLSQWRMAVGVAPRFVGGIEFNRHHADDDNGKRPFRPVPRAKALEALAFLDAHLLGPDAISIPTELLDQLAPGRWSHWGTRARTPDAFAIGASILSSQLSALMRLYSGAVLSRLQEHSFILDEALAISEVFELTTDPIWRELSGASPQISGPRRALQAEHLAMLGDIWISPSGSNPLGAFFGGASVPTEARAVARATIVGLEARCREGANLATDAATKSHLVAMAELAKGILGASMLASTH